MFILRITAAFGLLLSASTFCVSQSSPEAAPGISFPATGSVFALDKSSGAGNLVQIHASEIMSNSHAAGNFARSAIYVGARSSVELNGINAATNLSSEKTIFFVRLTLDDPEIFRNRVSLIRLKQSKDRRVVSSFSQNIFGGQRSRHYDEVAIRKVDVAGGAWLKIEPEAPLTPGEYGIVIMPKDPAFITDVVYDFDVAVNTAAPEK